MLLRTLSTLGLILTALTRDPTQSVPFPPQPCRPTPLTDSLARAWADSIQVTDRMGGTYPDGYPSLEGKTLTAEFRGECLTVAVLAWDGWFGGGVAVTDQTGSLLWAQAYHNAQGPKRLGKDKVAFWFTEGEGSGFLDNELVALCPLARDIWIECARVRARSIVTVSGLNAADSLAMRGMGYTEEASWTVRGDTIVLTRTATIQRYGERVPRRLALGTTRWVVP